MNVVFVADRVGSEFGPFVEQIDEAQARRALRAQISRLEQDLGEAVATAFQQGSVEFRVPAPVLGPKILSMGQLEEIRDGLAARLRGARLELEAIGRRQEAARLRLEAMLLDPGAHRFACVSRADLGDPGCGEWLVRPRLGIIGMMAGWWHVKLSSGCPLATGHPG